MNEMVDRINGLPKSIYSKPVKPANQQPKIDRNFDSFISDALKKPEAKKEVTFSNHAQKRLEQHGVSLDQTDLTQIEKAVQTLEDKGSKQSLILYEDLALIASIQNRTVITALKSDEMTEVTNIDSAIQVKRN